MKFDPHHRHWITCMVSRKGQPLPELVVTTNSTSRICYGMIQLFGLSYDEFGSCNKLYKLERAGYTPGAVDPSSQPACIFVSRSGHVQKNAGHDELGGNCVGAATTRRLDLITCTFIMCLIWSFTKFPHHRVHHVHKPSAWT